MTELVLGILERVMRALFGRRRPLDPSALHVGAPRAEDVARARADYGADPDIPPVWPAEAPTKKQRRIR